VPAAGHVDLGGHPALKLTKLVNNWPNNRMAELTPWRWSTEH
jgi:hypothetical protein